MINQVDQDISVGIGTQETKFEAPTERVKALVGDFQRTSEVVLPLQMAAIDPTVDSGILGSVLDQINEQVNGKNKEGAELDKSPDNFQRVTKLIDTLHGKFARGNSNEQNLEARKLLNEIDETVEERLNVQWEFCKQSRVMGRPTQ